MATPINVVCVKGILCKIKKVRKLGLKYVNSKEYS
jgi:hypothetical protein